MPALSNEAPLQLAHNVDDAWYDHLMRDGYCIIRDLVSPQIISAFHDDLLERFAQTPHCQGDFYGPHTKRFGSLLKRSTHAESLACHPLILRLAKLVLGPHCDVILLNLTQAVEIHPGAPEQPQHRDQDMWGGPKGRIEYLLNVIWPLTPFTAQNGATVLWPRSHYDQGNYLLPREDAITADMHPGAALLFLGSTLHAGGANMTDLPRTGIIISYCLGWLRPFENQWLCYPPEVAKMFSPEVAQLIGYSIHRPNLGNYEGQNPSILLKGEPAEYLPARDALRPEHEEFIRQLRQAGSTPTRTDAWEQTEDKVQRVKVPAPNITAEAAVCPK